jgi:hypothetical protein
MPVSLVKPDVILLFLDMDGVLNTPSSQKKWKNKPRAPSIYVQGGEWGDTPDPEIIVLNDNCVETFKLLLSQLPREYVIILSSTWRHAVHWDLNQATFKNHGLPELFSRTVHGVPGIEDQSRWDRGLEILHWIESNNCKENPFLVIDDEMFTIDKHIPKKHLVYVQNGWNSNRGFNDWHRRHALEKIQKQLGLPVRVFP